MGKDKTFGMRMTAEERAILEKEAEGLGMEYSELIRLRVFGEHRPQTEVEKRLKAIEDRLTAIEKRLKEL